MMQSFFSPAPLYFVILAIITFAFLLMLRALKGVLMQVVLLFAFYLAEEAGMGLYTALIGIQFLLTALALIRLKKEVDTNSIRIMEKTHVIPRVITKSGKRGEAYSSFDRLLF